MGRIGNGFGGAGEIEALGSDTITGTLHKSYAASPTLAVNPSIGRRRVRQNRAMVR